MIMVTGRNTEGYRLFHPLFKRDRDSMFAFRLPTYRLLSVLMFLNALAVLIVVIGRISERQGHFSATNGTVYLAVFALLLIELAWKIRFMWRRVRVEKPSLRALPTSSRLVGEHSAFWLAMFWTPTSLVDHYHPEHAGAWTALSVVFLLIALLPIINGLVLKKRTID